MRKSNIWQELADEPYLCLAATLYLPFTHLLGRPAWSMKRFIADMQSYISASCALRHMAARWYAGPSNHTPSIAANKRDAANDLCWLLYIQPSSLPPPSLRTNNPSQPRAANRDQAARAALVVVGWNFASFLLLDGILDVSYLRPASYWPPLGAHHPPVPPA